MDTSHFAWLIDNGDEHSQKYGGKWIAVRDQQVVGVGDTATEAAEKAREKVGEKPFVLEAVEAEPDVIYCHQSLALAANRCVAPSDTPRPRRRQLGMVSPRILRVAVDKVVRNSPPRDLEVDTRMWCFLVYAEGNARGQEHQHHPRRALRGFYQPSDQGRSLRQRQRSRPCIPAPSGRARAEGRGPSPSPDRRGGERRRRAARFQGNQTRGPKASGVIG